MTRVLTVKKLREILSEMEDNAVVLIPSDDHGYRDAYAIAGSALKNQYGYDEDHGEQFTPEAEYGKRIPAVIIE